ncbi:hypothetical protein EIN_027220 [Entamoeba invadens IP1]|uniref:hypothetical protein n=1 Tax=Entamoeba invadens IP1 TaxID=370355 RepID=UPI0002C3F378|nr:hypothetical protein EIN_027220 [Entamoeba invadens IP1]ELP90823.1 hypothetical protein EIN_027220 [Entamoeba invadens IP1]|eukprot:XP_004257594.1 hypothetical protein EIN_027220 [Entamoeba invadens IP1]
MSRADHTIIKNVVFYLESMRDLCQFVKINKHTRMLINTINYCPIKLLSKELPEVLMYYFPSTKAMCVNLLNSTLPKQIIEKVQCIEIDYFDHDKTTNVFKSHETLLEKKNTLQKVYKLKITMDYFETFAANILLYTHLCVLYINGINSTTHLNSNLLECISKNTLKKVIVCDGVDRLLSILTIFPFNKHKQIMYFFIMTNTTKHGDPPDFTLLKNTPQNLKVWTTFISKQTIENRIAYLPIQGMFDPYYNGGITILKDVNGHERTIDSEVFRCCEDKINIEWYHKEIFDLWGYSDKRGDEMKEQINDEMKSLNFSDTQNIHQIKVSEIAKCTVKMPKTANVIEISCVSEKMDLNGCKPETIEVYNYTGESLIINDQNLKRYVSGGNFTKMPKWVHNGIINNNKYVIDINTIEHFYVNDIGRMNVFEITQGSKKVTLLDSKQFLWDKEKRKIYLKGAEGRIDLSEIELHKVWCKRGENETENMFEPTLVLGDVWKVDITDEVFNEIHLGIIEELTLINVNAKKLEVSQLKQVVGWNSNFGAYTISTLTQQ